MSLSMSEELIEQIAKRTGTTSNEIYENINKIADSIDVIDDTVCVRRALIAAGASPPLTAALIILLLPDLMSLFASDKEKKQNE